MNLHLIKNAFLISSWFYQSLTATWKMAYLRVYIFVSLYTHTHKQVGCVNYLRFNSDRRLIARVIPWVYLSKCLWYRGPFRLHCYYMNLHCDCDPQKMAQGPMCYMFHVWVNHQGPVQMTRSQFLSLLQWISVYGKSDFSRYSPCAEYL